jgi:hypothetical protein
MAKVGRPPAVDKHGVVIQKSLVNVTIPTKLANFLKEKGVNRSKLFTDVVTKLYKEELCFKCYGENLISTLVGTWCQDCEGTLGRNWIKLNNCKNCGSKYNPGYNMFAQSKKLKGCWDCIPEEDRT